MEGPVVGKPWDSGDRRAHARAELDFVFVQIDVEVTTGSKRITGNTVNMSRGGVLLRLKQEIPAGLPCVVRFLESKGLVDAEDKPGTVLRSDDLGGYFHVAIEFDRPLDALKLPDESNHQPGR